MRTLFIVLGVFGGATILSKLISGDGAGMGRSMGELGRGWRGHGASEVPPSYWSRDMDTTRARYLMASKIQPWGHHSIDNV